MCTYFVLYLLLLELSSAEIVPVLYQIGFTKDLSLHFVLVSYDFILSALQDRLKYHANGIML